MKSVNKSRRNFLKSSTTLAAGVGLMPSLGLPVDNPLPRSSMGVAGSSYAFRWRFKESSKSFPGFENALQMLKHCESIGAGGIQVGTRNWSKDFSGKVRDYREKKELYVEGSIKLPQDDADIERFSVEVVNAREAGASILRTACLSGRRYENFQTGQAFEEFKKKAISSMHRAIPIIEKNKIKLAIENHKDWSVPDLLALLDSIESEWVGVNLDTGNNISFLEDPMYVIESLAPYSFTTHIKDMGIQDYDEGFLLSEVPLGEGQLDLKKIVEICQKHNPQIKFNLEMITRNPLKVPYYNETYWATFKELPASKVAGGLKWVKDNQSSTELPNVDGLSDQEMLAYEEENILSSFKYATESLKL